MPYPRRPPPADSLPLREPWLVTAVLWAMTSDWTWDDSNLSFLLTIARKRPGKRTVLVGAVTARPHRVSECLLRNTIAMKSFHAMSSPDVPSSTARCVMARTSPHRGRPCEAASLRAQKLFGPSDTWLCLRAMVVLRGSRQGFDGSSPTPFHGGGALSPACEPTPSRPHYP
jgi:hypothetical protein